MYRHTLALTVLLAASAASAHEGHHHPASPQTAPANPASTSTPALDEVSVQDCWIRNMPAGLPSGGYFVLRNSGAAAVALTGVSSPAYGMTMLHQTRTQGGMARMEHVDAVEVPAQGELVFKPGSYHAMLEKPASGLSVGQSVPLSFQFQGGGHVQAQCELRPASATSAH
jgi:copper(I)-binding protein